MLSKLTNLYFPVCSLVTTILLLFLFFSKKNFSNKETNVYSKLIVVGFFEALMYSFICLIAHFVDINSNLLLYHVLNKVLYIIYIVWFGLLYNYVINISFLKRQKKVANIFMNILYIIEFIISALIILFPVEIYFDKVTGLSNSSGLASMALYVGIALYIFSIAIVTIINLKSKDNRKYAPMLLLIILMIITMVIRIIDPLFSIYSNVLSFVTLVMYFTIENPDMKMLEEIRNSKNIAKQSNEEKAMFLYNTSQEIKLPVRGIEERCDWLLNECEMNDEVKEEVRNIKHIARNVSNVVNGVLDMSNVTNSSNIEISSVKYNIKNLFKEITSIARINITDQEKQLDFRVNIDENIPECLLGDAIRLKQIITTIINNSIKHTEKGFIEFNVSYVIKHNKCRIVITIEDSGCGIASSKLEKIFDVNKKEIGNYGALKISDSEEKLVNVKILINLMGGTVIANSELGKGTKITLVLDQEIAEQEKSSIMMTIEKLNSTKKILVVDDEENSLKQITKLLNKYDVNVDTVIWGEECLNKIRDNQKYDLILLDEDMPRLNGINTFDKLKKIDNFDIPVVIMISKEHLQYKEKYLINGFSGIIEKPINKKELDKVIENT